MTDGVELGSVVVEAEKYRIRFSLLLFLNDCSSRLGRMRYMIESVLGVFIMVSIVVFLRLFCSFAFDDDVACTEMWDFLNLESYVARTRLAVVARSKGQRSLAPDVVDLLL